MQASFVISNRVITTINALSDTDRSAISNAVAMEFIGGAPLGKNALTPMQTMIYSMIRQYILRDTARSQQQAS